MNLKDLTWENHKRAERSGFAKILLSGDITPQLYHKYLINQFYNYNLLEMKLRSRGFPPALQGVYRAEWIRTDINELEETYGLCYSESLLTKSTVEYISYIDTIDDLDTLVAHMYVRHFGDMYGGAIIKKRVPGAGRMYDFVDKENLKADLRALLSDDMAEEANVCFDYAVKLFEELANDDMGITS